MRGKFDYLSYLDQTKAAINHLEDRLDRGDIYRATDDVIDPDTLFEKAAHLYVKNPDSPNFPVAAPLYLHVDVAQQPGCECPCPCPPGHILGVTQTVWDDPAGQVWRRLGTVTQVVGQEPVVEWGEWKRVGSADCLNCVTRDQVRIKLNAPITFYIRHDGNDATGDGLTEATALATWSGFYNRYIIGPDAFDANFNTITINFGPGLWARDQRIN